MEVNNSASSSSTGTKSKIQPLGTFQEENHNWDDFRNNSFEDSFFDPHASVLNRLENEDVEDTSTSVGYLKHIYFKVVDPELIEYFTPLSRYILSFLVTFSILYMNHRELQ